MAEGMTLRDLVSAQIAQIDDKIGPETEDWPYAAILLASAIIGADEQQIEQAMEFDPDFVAMVAGRLRANGIWDGAELATREEYLDAESGGTSFCLDINVAKGGIERHGIGAAATFSMTPEGKAHVERMLRQ